MFRPISASTLLRMELAALAAVIVFYAINGLLPHQLAGSPLFDISLDNTFWLFHLTGLPGWLNANDWALIVLEAALVLFGTLAFFRHTPGRMRAMLILLVLLSLYMQTYSCMLTKISVILPVIFLPWCFSGELLRFTWPLPRYYLVYMMVSAAVFKLINGGLLTAGQLENILFNQHADLVFAGRGHLSLWVAGLIGGSAWIAKVSYFLVFLVELSFIVLLFTRRYDRVFIVLLLALCLTIYIVMRINTLEMALLALPLLRVSFENH